MPKPLDRIEKWIAELRAVAESADPPTVLMLLELLEIGVTAIRDHLGPCQGSRQKRLGRDCDCAQCMAEKEIQAMADRIGGGE